MLVWVGKKLIWAVRVIFGQLYKHTSKNQNKIPQRKLVHRFNFLCLVPNVHPNTKRSHLLHNYKKLETEEESGKGERSGGEEGGNLKIGTPSGTVL